MAMQLNSVFIDLENSNSQLEETNLKLKDVNTDLEFRVQQRTEELEKTLYKLQTTQAHMVQSEKISALGQMVTSIAHEINNPVIYFMVILNI
jgi:C4-dicarboxylate-specific signal transduction histidine kinase